MTHKPIVYTHHAARRLERRGSKRRVGRHRKRPAISYRDVRKVLTAGVRQPEGGPAREGQRQTWQARAFIGRGHELKALYVESAERILVIDIMWVGDPPGEPL